jgi:hypothetical protein
MIDSTRRALPEVALPSIDDKDNVVTASSDGTTLRTKVENSMDLPKILQEAFHKDSMFSKIMAHHEAYKNFRIRDRLI